MKRSVLLISLISILLSTSSCSKKLSKDDKFMLEGDFDVTSSLNISISDLKDKIENEDDFVLIVNLEGCEACLNFKQNVTSKYIANNHSVLYGIDLNELYYADDFDQKPAVKEAPAIIIYKDGKKIDTQKHTNSNKIFSDESKFKEYLEGFVIEPKMLTISEESLDKKIASSEDLLLYIGWNKCSDCKLLETRILNDYLKKSTKDAYLYYLESDKYRSKKPYTRPDENADDETIENWNNWISFATKYNFVEYRDGKVPTLQYYEDGKVKEMLVYHNDVITDGIVTISFFKSLEGSKMNEDELLSYHDSKAVEFLDKYYK